MLKNKIKKKTKYCSNEQYFMRRGTMISPPQLILINGPLKKTFLKKISNSLNPNDWNFPTI